MPSAELVSEEICENHLVNAVRAITPGPGPNSTHWPGLTASRFDRPQELQWAAVDSLSLCCVVHGRMRFIVEGEQSTCGPAQLLILTRGMRFQAEVLDATVDHPCLSLVLQLEPALVSSVLVDLMGHGAGGRSGPGREEGPDSRTAHVSSLDTRLADALGGFLRCLEHADDRRVLAPMRLREITYRLMQFGHVPRLVRAATTERADDPVHQVMRYIDAHIRDPLTVGDMARVALMSPSALTARFVAATGVGPYQFAKRMRLNRARVLLMEDELTVGEVVRDVGYKSMSYFINEFKKQFGVTPGAYARTQRELIAMRFDEATRRAA